MQHAMIFRPVLLALALAGSAFAAEFAVLTTGFQIEAERHEVIGDQVKLFTRGGGTMIIPSESDRALRAR